MCGDTLFPTVQPIHPTMHSYITMLFLVGILFIALSRNIHRLCILEAINKSGADILMDGENIGFFNIIVAVFQGSVAVRFCQDLDPNVSITRNEYRSANACHPPLTEDWEVVANAALSSTKQLLDCRDPDEETSLNFFIQTVVFSTYLHLFFSLQTTPTNTADVMWIAGKVWRTDDRHQDSRIPFRELSRLVKSSQNPSGVLALLSTTRRLTLATVCTIESRNGKIPLLRRAETLLRHPGFPDPDVTRVVENANKCNPPVQSVHGGLRLGSFPFFGTDQMEFVIPIDLLPPSACIRGSDGRCVSWLHRAALSSQPGCNNERWLIRITTIILSAIETEIRRAHLTIDGNENESEAIWEDWTLRKLRV